MTVALGAKGSFPSSSDDAMKPNNIIPLSKSPYENDWLPGNENLHSRTSGDERRLTFAMIILR